MTPPSSPNVSPNTDLDGVVGTPTVEPAHLQSYLNEFCFRFNRRRSRQRGLLFYRLLELAVDTDAVTYDGIKKNLRMRDERERVASGRRTECASVREPASGPPW